MEKRNTKPTEEELIVLRHQKLLDKVAKFEYRQSQNKEFISYIKSVAEKYFKLEYPGLNLNDVLWDSMAIIRPNAYDSKEYFRFNVRGYNAVGPVQMPFETITNKAWMEKYNLLKIENAKTRAERERNAALAQIQRCLEKHPELIEHFSNSNNSLG